MCRLAASYRKEGKADSPFFEASFVAHEKSPIERKTPLSLCGRISCITPALPPCVTPPSPFPLSQYTPDPFPPYSRPFWSAALYSPMLQVSAGALAQPRMPPRGFALCVTKGNWTSAPLWGRKSPLKRKRPCHFIPLFQSPKSFYRLAVASFFFLQGLVFASWASRIPDIKQALALNEAQLGGVLFATRGADVGRWRPAIWSAASKP